MPRDNSNPVLGGEAVRAFDFDPGLKLYRGQVALGGAASVAATAGQIPANFCPVWAALRADIGGVVLTTATRLALGLSAAFPASLCLSGLSMAAQAQTIQRYGSPGVIFSQRVATAANAPAANTESAFVFAPVIPTIPANFLKPGDIVRIRAQIITTAINATDTVIFKLKDTTDSAIIGQTATAALTASDVSILQTELSVRSIGAAGANSTYVCNSFSYNGTNAVVAGAADIPSGGFLASTSFDNTVALQLGASVTFSTNSATNSARCDSFVIEVLRPQQLGIAVQAASFPLVTTVDNAGTLAGTGTGNVSYFIYGYDIPVIPNAVV